MNTGKNLHKVLRNVNGFQKMLDMGCRGEVDEKLLRKFCYLDQEYEREHYDRDIKLLIEFDKNLIWNKKFMGLSSTDSISAIAVPTRKSLDYALENKLI